MNQVKGGLIFQLEGEKISSDAFKKAIDNFLGFIDDVSSQLSKKKHPLRWIISVEEGSIQLGLQPDPFPQEKYYVPDLINKIDTGINKISIKDERPPFYSDEALSCLKKLADLTKKEKNGIRNINIISNGNMQQVGPSISANIDLILRIQREEFSSFEGMLEIISVRGGIHFQIYELVHNRAIKCLIDEKLIPQALAAFNKRVYVFGAVKYRRGGIPDSIQVQELRVFRDKDSIPCANDVLGILKDIS